MYYTEALNELFKNSVNVLFECGLVGQEEDALEEIMMVIESYAIAGRALCLSSCANSIQTAFSRTIGQVAAKAVPYVIRPLEAFFLSCPQETALFLIQSGLILSILYPCLASVPAVKEMKVLEAHEEADVAVVSYLSIVARLALYDPQFLTQAIQAIITSPVLGPVFNLSSNDSNEAIAVRENILQMLIRLMIDKFDSVAYSSSGAWRRKLWALALLSLCTHASTVILEWFPEVHIYIYMYIYILRSIYIYMYLYICICGYIYIYIYICIHIGCQYCPRCAV
jgi:hypothetical protein